MYRAKERGRGRYELFDDVLRRRVLTRLRTENELRRGIEHGELRVVYQPVVELARRHGHRGRGARALAAPASAGCSSRSSSSPSPRTPG